jgi:hypothetical protein
MLSEGRKRDAAANAILALSFAANAAQSPQALVRSGNVEAPGIQLMSNMMRKRKEANRNLDSGRVSHPARNRKMKTFKEFVEEAYLVEAKGQHFSSRAELEKHHGGIPSGYYANNAGSSESPKWRLKPKSGGAQERKARAERMSSLSSAEERAAADVKKKKLQRAGLEAHHITPTHYSAKIKSSMSDSEWEARKKRDAADGIYHGHHPKNLMGATTSRTPESRSKRGISHRAGGAHELEGKTRDIAHVGHKGLLVAAHKKRLRKEREINKRKP